MKHCLPVLLLLLSPGLFAQEPAGLRVTHTLLGEAPPPLRESVIWEETFENGIPEDWVNQENGGVAFWEYRGPDTSPSNDVGTRGSCLPDGTTGAPLESETWSDGFVIFDSNWWDDPEGPCGNLGSGEAPGPHLAVLEMPEIDLSAYDKVGITFTQYAKNYQADMRVELRTGGSDWQTVWSDTLIINEETEKDAGVRINITTLAALQAAVQIRFVFEGQYYFWMLDDVAVVELDANNLFISDPGYGDFDFDAADHPTGFEDMEYGLYPDEFAPQLTCSARAHNYGAETQTGVGLQVTVIRDADGSQLYSGNSPETLTLLTMEQALLETGAYNMPGITGGYSLAYEVYQNEAEESEEDNRDTVRFAITDVTYARDKGPVKGVIVPQEAFADEGYEIGNIYLATAAGTWAYSVSAALAVGSSVGTNIYAALYEFSVDTAINAGLLAVSDWVTITPEMVNGAGQLNLVHLPFDTPVGLDNGHAYLAVVGCLAPADQMLVGTNGVADPFSSWIHFFSNLNWFYLTQVPIVRLNIGVLPGVAAPTDTASATQPWPNPADECIHVTAAETGVPLVLTDLAGNILRQWTASTGVNRLSVANLASGTYLLRTGHTWQRIVVEH